MTIDVSAEVAAHEATMKGKKAAPRRIRIGDVDAIWDNQTHEMRTHLKHDRVQFMLPQYRDRPRSSRPAWVERATRQLLQGMGA